MSFTLDIPITGDGSDSGNGYAAIYPVDGTWLNVCDDPPASPDDLASFITGASVTDVWHTFTFDSPNLSVDARIISVTAVVRARCNGQANKNVQGRIKAGGTYYDGTLTTVSNTWGTCVNSIWTTNPLTGVEWVAEDINGTGPFPLTEVGFFSASSAPQIDVSQVFLRVVYTLSHYEVIYPTVAGHQNAGNAWGVTGAATAHEAVDDEYGHPDDATTYCVPAGTAPHWMTWGFVSPDIPTENTTIIDLTIVMRVGSGYLHTSSFDGCVRVNGTTYYPGAGQAGATSSFATRSLAITNNPATDEPWTVEDINGTGDYPLEEFGLKIFDSYYEDKVTQVFAFVTWYMTNYRSLEDSSCVPAIAASRPEPSRVRVPTGDGFIQGFELYHVGGMWPGNLWSFVDDPPSSPDDETYLNNWYANITCYAFFTFNPQFDFPSNTVINKVSVYYRHSMLVNLSSEWLVTPALVIGDSREYATTGATPLALVWGTDHYDWSVNPVTEEAWTVADVNGLGNNPLLGFGVKIENIETYALNRPWVGLSQIYVKVDCDFIQGPSYSMMGLKGTGQGLGGVVC